MKQYIRTNPHHSFLYFVGAGLLVLTFVTGFLSWSTSANLYASLREVSPQTAFASSAHSSQVTKPSTTSTAAASKTETERKSSVSTQKSSSTPATSSSNSQVSGAVPTSAPSGATAAGKQLFVYSSGANRPDAIANQPLGYWLTDSYGIQNKVSSIVSQASAGGRVATLVAYNIPGRDCGLYSKGGASGSDAYKQWIRSFAAGIGSREAIVILEPDSLAGIDCLTDNLQQDRYALLADAVTVLSSTTNASVYLDGGNSGWQSSGEMAARLKNANIAGATGFALNVSNFYTTTQSTSYGKQISAKVGGKHFVIDTSRNGNGSNGEWCNPDGRALGVNPTTSVSGVVDAYLWVKIPGESDGDCGRGDPSAGTWMPDYADKLIARRG